MKVTTKLAKNGARLYYVDSKRVSRDKALESAAQNRVGNPFVIEYDTEQNHYLIQGGIEKHIYTDRRTFDKLNIRIDNYHGFTVYCGTCQLRTFVCNFGAKNFAATIEDAFINGEHGIKITVDGKISILPTENVGNLTDSALAASNSRLAAFRTNDTATEIDASEYAISQAAFDIAVKAERDNAFNAKPSLERYKSARCSINHTIDKHGRHMWFDSCGIIRKQKAADILSVYYGLTVDEYLACEKIAEAEYLSKLDAVFNARDVEELAAEYAVTVDAQEVATEAEIENAGTVAETEIDGYDERAFDFLPNFEDDELRDYLYDLDERQQLLEDKYEPKTTADTVTEEDKTYTLTVYATEDFKGLYGGDTLVKNFDTCQRLYKSGKDIIFTNSWKLERGGKTIAAGDGVKDFCRFITCEFDVSERLAEIVDAKSVDMEICGEHVYFRKGKFMSVMSPKYHALFHAETGFDGTDHYDIFTADKNGKFTRGNFVTEEEFFNVMVERGGCTIEVDDYAVSPDAQDSEPVAEIKSPEPEITKAEKIAALERSIARVIAERDEAHEELAKAEADDEISQYTIDYIKGEITALTNKYRELVRELETLKNTSDTPAPPEVDDYAVTVEAQEVAIEAEIENAKFAQYLRDEAQREHEFELLAAFGKQAPEFKRFGSFKPKAAHIDATLQAKTFKPALCKEMFAQGRGKFVGKIEVGSYAEAMALIENVANDRFELDSEHKRNYFDEDGKFVEYCSREFINVDNQNEIFIFSEHFKNGKLTRVDFQKGFSFSYKCKCVEILIKPAPDTPVDAAIETLDDDMKDAVRAELEPFKAEYNAAIAGIYLDDLSGGDSESGEIIPAADLLQKVIPLALTDFSSTAYRKNPDGNFSRDKAAFKRLEQLERKIFAANGHKIGVDNSGNTQPDDFAEKMAELKADLEKSKAVRDNAAEKRAAKLKEYNDAQKAVNEAEILVDRKREAVAKCGQAYAKVLERKLFDKPLMIPPTMLFIDQDGDIVGTGLEPLEILFHEHELKFQIVTDWIFLGEYDTPAQVETVIDDLKTAIAFGSRTEFQFPTVDEVNAWHNQLREDARRELEFEYQAAFGEEYTEPFHKIGDVIASLYTTHTA